MKLEICLAVTTVPLTNRSTTGSASIYIQVELDEFEYVSPSFSIRIFETLIKENPRPHRGVFICYCSSLLETKGRGVRNAILPTTNVMELLHWIKALDLFIPTPF
jgi:hypothetical protein